MKKLMQFVASGLIACGIFMISSQVTEATELDNNFGVIASESVDESLNQDQQLMDIREDIPETGESDLVDADISIPEQAESDLVDADASIPEEEVEITETDEEQTSLLVAPQSRTLKGADTAQSDSSEVVEKSAQSTSNFYVRNVKAAGQKNGNVRITWSKLAGADGYFIFHRGPNDNKETYLLATSNNYTYHTTALPGYNFYRVYPYVNRGNTKVRGAAPDYTYTMVKPKPVSGLKATQAGESIKLTWNRSLGATDYIIYRSTEWSPNFTYLYMTKNLQFVDTWAHGGFNYYRIYPRYKTNDVVGQSNRYVYSYRLPDHIKSYTITPFANGNSVLNWKSIEGADQYLIFRRTAFDKGMTYIGFAQGNQFIDTQSLPGAVTYNIMPAMKINNRIVYRTPNKNTYKHTIVWPKAVTSLRTGSAGRWSNVVRWNAQRGVNKFVIYRKTPDQLVFTYHLMTSNKNYLNNFLYTGTYFYRVYPIVTVNNRDYWGKSDGYTYGVIRSIGATEQISNVSDLIHLGRNMIRDYREGVRVTYYAPTAYAQNQLDQVMQRAQWFHWSDRLAHELPTRSEVNRLYWKGQSRGSYIDLLIWHGYAAKKSQYDLVLKDAERVAREALSKFDNDVARLKYGFDYVLNRMDYAYDSTGEAADYTPSGISTQSAYSAYKDRLTVCNGYASYLLAIYQKMGYEVYYPRTLHYLNPNNDHLDHAWVMVKVNSRWYHVDPTWADTAPKELYYNFFLTSAEKMRNNDFYRDSNGRLVDQQMHLMADYFPPSTVNMFN